VGLFLLAGCASVPPAPSPKQALKTVAEYRRLYAANPSDPGLKIKLKEAELDASEECYEAGLTLEAQDLLDDAAYQFRQGLSAMPENEKLSNALKRVLGRKEARALYGQAVDLEQSGREDEARSILDQILADDPENQDAKAFWQKLENRRKSGGLILSSEQPISLHFNRTDIKAGFNFIGKSFGLNVIFDGGLKDQKVDFSADDVTFEQALNLLMETTHTFYKQVGPRTILVSDDNKDKRDMYDDLVSKTIQLNSANASDMVALLKSALDIKHIGFDKNSNTLLIRAPRDVLDWVEKIIAANDRPPAEVMLDVEILEVDKSKEDQFGFDYGSQITYTGPVSAPSLNSGQSIANILAQGTLTIPSVTFNYLKQDVDAKTIAHPQVRVMSSQQAKIHIGDKVPLPAAQIQAATGLVQTSYNYTDIGVLLNVLPIVNPDRTIQVKLDMEVSSLGANLGTPDNPAYDIGTRDADTYMLLHDGETAVLGGLIQDTDSKTDVKIPILGDIPFIGGLFATNTSETASRTDLLLTITPRIVRDWTFSRNLQEVESGTEVNPSDQGSSGLFSVQSTGTPVSKASATQVVPTVTTVVDTVTVQTSGPNAVSPTPTSSDTEK
jgi:general secretion pathway protein D